MCRSTVCAQLRPHSSLKWVRTSQNADEGPAVLSCPTNSRLPPAMALMYQDRGRMGMPMQHPQQFQMRGMLPPEAGVMVGLRVLQPGGR